MFYGVGILFSLALAGVWPFTYIVHLLLSKHNYTSRTPPGPSGIPFIGHLHLMGDHPHRSLQKLSQKYGPVMQLQLGLLPTIVVSSSEMVESFLKHHDLNFVSRPKIQASKHLSYGTRGVIVSDYGPYWRTARKLCSLHLLSVSKVDSFKSLRKQEVINLIRSLEIAAVCDETVNISSQVRSMIENVSYTMIFGSKCKGRSEFKQCIEEALGLIATTNIADFIPFLEPLDLQGLKRRMKKVSRVMDTFLEEIIDEHEQNFNCEHKDFIDVMISQLKSGNAREERFTRSDIKAIILDIIESTSNTSAATIEWTLTELLMHSEVMTRVQEELTTVIGMDRIVEEGDLGKLVYLDMVIKEVIRLRPVSPIIPRKSINDITIEGFHIPKNSLVIINAWAVGRDQKMWSDTAEDFCPERFNNVEIDIRGPDYKMIPFGAGRRKCPGTELGLRTVKLVLAQILHCFSLELPNGVSPADIDTKEIFGIAIRRVNPLHIVPTSRLAVKTI
ncbi:hypothetical protein ACHQM5_005721 [Ranunculus cassubicifolius]